MTRLSGSGVPSFVCVSLMAAILAALPGSAHAHPYEPGASSAPAEDEHLTPAWLGNIPGFGGIAPDHHPPEGATGLEGCTISNPLFKEDPARVDPFVPDGYELGSNGFFGPGVATVMAAVLACDAVKLDGGSSGESGAVVTLAAVQVVADASGDGPTDVAWDLYNRSTLNFLPSSSWYLVAAQTDNGDLARRMHQAGLPVVHAPDLAYENDYAAGGTTKSDVVRRHNGFELATTTMFADPFIHNHDWFFWHDLPTGRTGFLLHLKAMEDSSCGYHTSPIVQGAQPECGAQFTAQPGNEIASLLGSPVRHTPFAFNHPPSENPGYIALPDGRGPVRGPDDGSHP